MNQDESMRSRERVRVLAGAVSLPLDESRIPALADALDAALKSLDRLDALGIQGGAHIALSYDPAWTNAKGDRR